LLMGLLASHDLTATFIGDASLSKRPMARVTQPLSAMGASFMTSPGDRLPLTMRGACPAVPLDYRLPVASAQVKSAILLAGLNAPGITRIVEPIPTRDHSERMLKGFGAELNVDVQADGTRIITLHGEAELKPQQIVVPGDPSSAAFPVVAALIVPGSDIVVTNVGLNPTRAGLFDVLKAMGGDIVFLNEREIGGEPVADIRVRHSLLTGIDVPPEIAPSMIDEFPILFVATAMAQGVTRTCGLDELRVKESDRLALMARGLARMGVTVEEAEDGLTIHGSHGEPLAGGNQPPLIAASLDHRIAMSFAIAGLASRSGLEVDDMRPVATSFPGFTALLRELGAEA
ncbi:MAG: 3-phosphoshikimate 1-carboxyvinyltransferase, partial [Sphingobium sp.]